MILLRLAVVFLTRIRLPLPETLPDGALARSSLFFPLVGAAIGALIGLLFWLANLALPAMPAALLAIGGGILLTGGLHEDGLADCADGFGGGKSREDKIRIMRDSAIGSYGALALILSVGLRATALADIARPVAAMAVAHGVARATLPVAMALMPAASDSGVAAGAGKPRAWQATVAALLALALAAAFGNVVILAAAIGGAALCALVAYRQIGGYSGDVLGAMEQIAEMAALLAAAS